jgi:biotin carboxyl carrier protein
MKMVNAIRASEDAVVAEVLVAEGQQVGYGAPLVRLAER